jgi:hypothetical protein
MKWAPKLEMHLSTQDVEHLRAILDSFVSGQQMTKRQPNKGAYGDDYIFAKQLMVEIDSWHENSKKTCRKCGHVEDACSTRCLSCGEPLETK